jgi:hypothetical protein
MNSSGKRYLSFVAMTVLIFAGSSLFGLFGGVSTGPNLDCFIGVPPFFWLIVHRGSRGVSFENFQFVPFIFAVCFSILIAWILLRLLHGTRKTS